MSSGASPCSVTCHSDLDQLVRNADASYKVGLVQEATHFALDFGSNVARDSLHRRLYRCVDFHVIFARVVLPPDILKEELNGISHLVAELDVDWSQSLVDS